MNADLREWSRTFTGTQRGTTMSARTNRVAKSAARSASTPARTVAAATPRRTATSKTTATARPAKTAPTKTTAATVDLAALANGAKVAKALPKARRVSTLTNPFIALLEAAHADGKPRELPAVPADDAIVKAI